MNWRNILQLALVGTLGSPLLSLVGCEFSGANKPLLDTTTTMVEFIRPNIVAQASQMRGPLLFDTASDFSEGVAMVRLQNRIGYIDRNGSLTINVLDDNVTVAGKYVDGLALARVLG